MLCPLCRSRPLTTAFIQDQHGCIRHRLCCYVCATQTAEGGGERLELRSAGGACPICRLDPVQAQQRKTAGCPWCYEIHASVFKPELWQEGPSFQHRGLRPQSAPEIPPKAPPEPVAKTQPSSLAPVADRPSAQTLRRRLDAAILNEDFELAAKLRDQLRLLLEAADGSL